MKKRFLTILPLLAFLIFLAPSQGQAQDILVKPTFAYNFNKFLGIKTHSLGGGLNIERRLGFSNRTIGVSLLYFGGKGALTQEDFDRITRINRPPANPDILAERSNMDMFYVGVNSRQYFQGDALEGPYAGLFAGGGIPTQDNPIGYYWDIGGQIGFQKVLDSGLTFEPYMKLGYGMWLYDANYYGVYYGFYGTYGAVLYEYVDMFALQTGISIGFAR